MHKTRAMKTKAGLLKLHSKSKKYGTILNIILNIFYPLANLLHHILKCAHSTKNLKKNPHTHTLTQHYPKYYKNKNTEYYGNKFCYIKKRNQTKTAN